MIFNHWEKKYKQTYALDKVQISKSVLTKKLLEGLVWNSSQVEVLTALHCKVQSQHFTSNTSYCSQNKLIASDTESKKLCSHYHRAIYIAG